MTYRIERIRFCRQSQISRFKEQIVHVEEFHAVADLMIQRAGHTDIIDIACLTGEISARKENNAAGFPIAAGIHIEIGIRLRFRG